MVHNGEIVVVYVEDSKEEGVTVKKFYKENGFYRLQPENDTMEPIIANNVTIVEKVQALMRTIA